MVPPATAMTSKPVTERHDRLIGQGQNQPRRRSDPPACDSPVVTPLAVKPGTRVARSAVSSGPTGSKIDAKEEAMTSPATTEERRDELVERLFEARSARWISSASTSATGSGCTGRSRTAGPSTSAELASAAGVHERYAREWLEQQAMAGILEAEDPGASDAERRYGLPAGHDEVAARRGQPQRHGADGSARRRMCPADPRRARGVPDRRRACPTPSTAPTSTRARRASPGRCSTTCSRPSGCPPCRPSTSAQGRSAGAGRRRRVRARPVEHRDRPRLPQGRRSTGSTSTQASIARAQRAAARKRRRGPRDVPLPGRGGPELPAATTS